MCAAVNVNVGGVVMPPRAMLWQSAQPPWLPTMYDPVVAATLTPIFEAAGATVTRGAGGVREASFVRNVSALRPGDTFVWIGMHADFRAAQSVLPTLRSGIRRIWYQTEPLEGNECPCSNRTCFPHRVRASEPSTPAGRHRHIDELWDFSRHNIEVCERSRQGAPLLRHVPLAATSAPGDPPANYSKAKPSPLLFFGYPFHGTTRLSCYKSLKQRLGAKQLRYTYRQWKPEDIRSNVLNLYSIYLNLHKSCGDAHNPLTFRVPLFINAGKMVLSERAHPLDELDFKGAVTFAHNLSHLADIYEQTLRDGSWRERGRRARLVFTRRFQPLDIAWRAGIYRRRGGAAASRASHAQQHHGRGRGRGGRAINATAYSGAWEAAPRGRAQLQLAWWPERAETLSMNHEP